MLDNNVKLFPKSDRKHFLSSFSRKGCVWVDGLLLKIHMPDTPPQMQVSLLWGHVILVENHFAKFFNFWKCFNVWSVERMESLLNAIKQQIFIPHPFWSRHCYYYKSEYHSLVSNSARDFIDFSRTSVFVLWSRRSSIIWLQANLFGLISCPFPLYSPQTVTQTLSTTGTLLYFLCLEFVFIPAFTSMSFSYPSSLSLNVTSSESSLLMSL